MNISFRVIIKRLVVVLILTALFLQTPTYQWTKSLLVMGVYSAYEASSSVLADNGITIKIPGGMGTIKDDWYPFVITFQDDIGFSRYIDQEARMTVLYNFGHFSPLSFRSDYYDLESPYYNSFYGAYAVELEGDKIFGFLDGEPNIEEMSQVPTYDMKYLVLDSIGNSDPVLEFDVVDQGRKVLFEEEEWFYFDAEMTVSGSIHNYDRDYRAYIQYGRPPSDIGDHEDYELVEMVGRIYAKYIEEKDVTLFFYCITTDMSVIDEWESNQMARTELILK